MEAVTWLHGTAGMVLLGALVALAVAAVLALRVPAARRWADAARRLLLGALVAEAALGLVIALRGAAPAETIHWLYGAAVIVALLVPGALAESMAHRRAAVAAGAAVLATVFAWRLWGSG
ncbi:MAG: hypothetical protein K5924_11895 [Chloroflexi bacterium]|nr:hypothetical protein [Chloroflexota bacterium]